jgi:pilus assembly protein CpaB
MRSDRALLGLAAASAVGILAVITAAYWLKSSNSPESVPAVVVAKDVPVVTGLAAAIEPGFRAITLPVSSEVAGVAGFILPGNYVDVILSTRDEAGQLNATRVLQRVKVLAVDQDRSVKDPSQVRVGKELTLEVTFQQAQQADAARALGALTFVLRGQEDDRLLDRNEPAPKNESMQKGVSTSSSPQVANVRGVEVIRGTTRTVETGLAP